MPRSRCRFASSRPRSTVGCLVLEPASAWPGFFGGVADGRAADAKGRVVSDLIPDMATEIIEQAAGWERLELAVEELLNAEHFVTVRGDKVSMEAWRTALVRVRSVMRSSDRTSKEGSAHE